MHTPRSPAARELWKSLDVVFRVGWNREVARCVVLPRLDPRVSRQSNGYNDAEFPEGSPVRLGRDHRQYDIVLQVT
jgi:hypothetical protein